MILGLGQACVVFLVSQLMHKRCFACEPCLFNLYFVISMSQNLSDSGV